MKKKVIYNNIKILIKSRKKRIFQIFKNKIEQNELNEYHRNLSLKVISTMHGLHYKSNESSIKN